MRYGKKCVSYIYLRNDWPTAIQMTWYRLIWTGTRPLNLDECSYGGLPRWLLNCKNMPPTIRTKEDIAAEMLRAVASSPRRATHIMFMGNLSYSQLRFYLEFLRSRDLIKRTVDRKWSITDIGREYLYAYDELEKLLGQNTKGEKYSSKTAEA